MANLLKRFTFILACLALIAAGLCSLQRTTAPT